MSARFEFNDIKNEVNNRKHGISLNQAEEFDFATAIIDLDQRWNYGELRFLAMGMIGSRLHVLVYTLRGDVIRVISLRKANKREVRQYEKKYED